VDELTHKRQVLLLLRLWLHWQYAD